jgi:hypothetical protein
LKVVAYDEALYLSRIHLGEASNNCAVNPCLPKPHIPLRVDRSNYQNFCPPCGNDGGNTRHGEPSGFSLSDGELDIILGNCFILPRHKQFDATVSLLQSYRDYSLSFPGHQKLKPVHIPLQSVKETDRQSFRSIIPEKSAR